MRSTLKMIDESPIRLTKTFLSVITHSQGGGGGKSLLLKNRTPGEKGRAKFFRGPLRARRRPRFKRNWCVDRTRARRRPVGVRTKTAAPAGGRAAGGGRELRTRTYADAELGRAALSRWHSPASRCAARSPFTSSPTHYELDGIRGVRQPALRQPPAPRRGPADDGRPHAWAARPRHQALPRPRVPPTDTEKGEGELSLSLSPSPSEGQRHVVRRSSSSSPSRRYRGKPAWRLAAAERYPLASAPWSWRGKSACTLRFVPRKRQEGGRRRTGSGTLAASSRRALSYLAATIASWLRRRGFSSDAWRLSPRDSEG